MLFRSFYNSSIAADVVGSSVYAYLLLTYAHNRMLQRAQSSAAALQGAAVAASEPFDSVAQCF